jgi:LDH2 family malate/lactate/ureidoglycolate dehydrogenase
MPKIQADRLEEIGRVLFVAAGTPKDEAELVMRHIVGANLVGHDSHGVIQIPTYIDRIKVGHIVPGAPWVIVKESANHTVVDGHWAFGYVANDKAMRLTIEKAEKGNVAAATVFRQGHIGRLSSYSQMAAKAGMIGLVTADSGRSPKAVAPFGGREARLGTNPITIAIPSDLDGPLYLDMATSAAAAGKIAVAVARNEQVPDGWVIGSDGKPTNDPRQLRQGGALLPMGGPDGGYKGYGLAVMVEILCGLLTGLGFGVEPSGRHNDGCFMACFKVDAFRPLAEFKKEVGEFIRYLKATPPAEGSSGVLYPGEIEHIKEQDRRKNGIEVEDSTWSRLRLLADEYKVTDQLGLGDVE